MGDDFEGGFRFYIPGAVLGRGREGRSFSGPVVPPRRGWVAQGARIGRLAAAVGTCDFYARPYSRNETVNKL